MESFSSTQFQSYLSASASQFFPQPMLIDQDQVSLAPFTREIWTQLQASESLTQTLNCLQAHSLTPHMRARMVDWMIDVMLKLDSSPHSIFLAIRIMDTYFKRSSLSHNQDDLLPTGLISMFLASKYNDRFPIRLQIMYEGIGFRKVSLDVLRMRELMILRKLEFQIGLPTALDALNLLLMELSMNGVMAKSCEVILLLVQLDPDLAAIAPSKQATAALFITCMTYIESALPVVMQISGYDRVALEEDCQRIYDFLMNFPEQGRQYEAAMRNLGFEIGDDETHPLFKFSDAELEAENLRLLLGSRDN